MYNDDGSVNITQKGNSGCVKRLRSDIPSRSICEMLENFSRVEFQKPGVSKFRKRKKIIVLFTSFIKREIRTFHVVVVQ